jgi:NAD(P)-dependent dehydrogenase (short-subunit alcohol dehydrogenase family)
MTLEGKTALITGASAGIGEQIARGLAKAGARVFFAGRDRQKTETVIDTLRAETRNGALEFLPLDLADLASVKACADAFLAKGLPLDLLIANAGLANVKGLTRQGFEMTFGVNYLGHYLLVRLLEPALKKAHGARLVLVGSRAHERATGVDFASLNKPATTGSTWTAYGQSKLCETLFAKELARRWPPETARVYIVHPGVIASEIWRTLPFPLGFAMKAFLKSPEEGARSALHCAMSDEVATHHGRYYGEDGSERKMNPLAEDPGLAKELWEKSEAWVAPFLAR